MFVSSNFSSSNSKSLVRDDDDDEYTHSSVIERERKRCCQIVSSRDILDQNKTFTPSFLASLAASLSEVLSAAVEV